MNRQQWTLIVGASLGAGLMFLLDPRAGRRRRALMRDKAAHGLRLGRETVRKTSRDLGNRSHGLVAEAKSHLQHGEVDDATLAARVRSKLGRWVSHPREILVEARDGRVTLLGQVPEVEADRLVRKVGKVKGVEEVVDRLDRQEEFEDMPAEQDTARQQTVLAS